MELLAPAKINLFLAVTGRRPDGYHNLVTLFCRVGIYDTIQLDFHVRDILVSCSHPDVPEDDTNIVHKAAAVFAHNLHVQKKITMQGVGIAIEKNIPVGAGLGGGSSNAASVLMGLNEFYGTPFSDQALMDMGLLLGADVPFFIFKKPALARGIGEKLTVFYANLPRHVVLVNPGMAVSTGQVYKNLNLGLTKCEQKLNCLLFKKESFRADHHLCNDLEEVTESLCPVIPLIKEKLCAFGADGALMTGSGPTVFGLFSDGRKAEQAFDLLSENANWKVFLSRLLL